MFNRAGVDLGWRTFSWCSSTSRWTAYHRAPTRSGEQVEKLSPDRLRAVIEVLMTVTVAPVDKGDRVFNPDRVDVVWKEDL